MLLPRFKARNARRTIIIIFVSRKKKIRFFEIVTCHLKLNRLVVLRSNNRTGHDQKVCVPPDVGCTNYFCRKKKLLGHWYTLRGFRVKIIFHVLIATVNNVRNDNNQEMNKRLENFKQISNRNVTNIESFVGTPPVLRIKKIRFWFA